MHIIFIIFLLFITCLRSHHAYADICPIHKPSPNNMPIEAVDRTLLEDEAMRFTRNPLEVSLKTPSYLNKSQPAYTAEFNYIDRVWNTERSLQRAEMLSQLKTSVMEASDGVLSILMAGSWIKGIITTFKDKSATRYDKAESILSMVDLLGIMKVVQTIKNEDIKAKRWHDFYGEKHYMYPVKTNLQVKAQDTEKRKWSTYNHQNNRYATHWIKEFAARQAMLFQSKYLRAVQAQIQLMQRIYQAIDMKIYATISQLITHHAQRKRAPIIPLSNPCQSKIELLNKAPSQQESLSLQKDLSGCQKRLMQHELHSLLDLTLDASRSEEMQHLFKLNAIRFSAKQDVYTNISSQLEQIQATMREELKNSSKTQLIQHYNNAFLPSHKYIKQQAFVYILHEASLTMNHRKANTYEMMHSSIQDGMACTKYMYHYGSFTPGSSCLHHAPRYKSFDPKHDLVYSKIIPHDLNKMQDLLSEKLDFYINKGFNIQDENLWFKHQIKGFLKQRNDAFFLNTQIKEHLTSLKHEIQQNICSSDNACPYPSIVQIRQWNLLQHNDAYNMTRQEIAIKILDELPKLLASLQQSLKNSKIKAKLTSISHLKTLASFLQQYIENYQYKIGMRALAYPDHINLFDEAPKLAQALERKASQVSLNRGENIQIFVQYAKRVMLTQSIKKSNLGGMARYITYLQLQNEMQQFPAHSGSNKAQLFNAHIPHRYRPAYNQDFLDRLEEESDAFFRAVRYNYPSDDPDEIKIFTAHEKTDLTSMKQMYQEHASQIKSPFTHTDAYLRFKQYTRLLEYTQEIENARAYLVHSYIEPCSNLYPKFLMHLQVLAMQPTLQMIPGYTEYLVTLVDALRTNQISIAANSSCQG